MTRLAPLLALTAIIWMAMVIAGHRIMFQYATVSGACGTSPDQWPEDSHVSRSSARATLVMFAHPHCPCTRATIDELAKVLCQGDGLVDAFVVFVKPMSCSDSWVRTDLWNRATAIPGVYVLCDQDGAEAARFGVKTSGHALLYTADGRRVFSGGITEVRGHDGDNLGRSAIVALLNTGVAAHAETPVFGCPLRDFFTER